MQDGRALRPCRLFPENQLISIRKIWHEKYRPDDENDREISLQHTRNTNIISTIHQNPLPVSVCPDKFCHKQTIGLPFSNSSAQVQCWDWQVVGWQPRALQSCTRSGYRAGRDCPRTVRARRCPSGWGLFRWFSRSRSPSQNIQAQRPKIWVEYIYLYT